MRSILGILFFLLPVVVVCQNNSFVKVFDNGELGVEYVTFLDQRSSNELRLISAARMTEDYRVNMRMRTIELGSSDSEIVQENQDDGSTSHNVSEAIWYDGYYYSAGTIRDSVEKNYLEIVKFDMMENYFEYQDGIGNKIDKGSGIDVDVNGDIIVCGYRSKFPESFENESFVVKIDTLGNVLWTRSLHARYNELKARSVASDYKGNVYVLADEESIWPSIQQVALIKLNSEGDSLWTKYYSGGGSEPVDLKMNSEGNLMISAMANFDGFGRAFTLMQVDRDGELLWTRSYANEFDFEPFAQRFIELRNGGYAVCLNVGYPSLLILDRDGHLVNRHDYNQYSFNSVVQLIELFDGSFAIAGNISDFNEEIPRVMWLIKTDVNGELVSKSIDFEFPDFKIYPNPTVGNLYIEGMNFELAYLLNAEGQVLAKYSRNSHISLNDYPAGTYYLLFQTTKGVFTEKVVRVE